MKTGNFTKRIDKFKAATLLVLAGLLVLGFSTAAEASTRGGWNGRAISDQVLTSIAAAPGGGYWTQLDRLNDGWDGLPSTERHAGAPDHGSEPLRGSIAARAQGGYWIVGPNGEIVARGGAPALCGGDLSTCSGFGKDRETTQIVAAAATHSGHGLYAVGRDGAVWTAGDARPHGDVQNDKNGVPTGIVTTPEGGYIISMHNGGVHSRNAPFWGSFGGKDLGPNEISGIALSKDAAGNADGYWLVATDGGVFTFGNAPFLGSSGGNNGGSRVTGIAATHDGEHYAWVHHSGRVQFSQ